MKLTSFLTTTLAASAILFTACDKKDGGTTGGGSSGSSSSSSGGAATSEKDALDRFKKDVEQLKADGKAMEAESKGDPMAMMGQVKLMFEKMLAIKTDGLPADLKTALSDAQTKIAGAKAMLADIPTGAELKTLAEKAATDPAVMAKFTKLQTDFPKVMEEAGPAMDKVEEIAKKYGINMKDN